MDTPVLEAFNIRKSFNGVEVLRNVNFTLLKGKVHALVGQNGAGKSTLMKILNGVYEKDAGIIKIDGKPTEYNNPQRARMAGIGMVFQDFSLVNTLSVAQNIFLTHEPLQKNGILIHDKDMRRRTKELLADIGVGSYIDPDEIVENLGVGSKQLVEIAKALSAESRILILDEPTASLSNAEIESLFGVIRTLKAKGISIVYISHYLRDVMKICDFVTVLRDGQNVFSKEISQTGIDEIISQMIGRKVSYEKKRKRTIARDCDPLLQIDSLTTAHVTNISFSVWPGETVGLAGLLGSGRTEILNAIFGIDRIEWGTIRLRGKPVRIRNTWDALKNGIALIPEDRRQQGLISDFTVKDNMLLAILEKIKGSMLLDDRKGSAIAEQYVVAYNVKTDGITQQVRFLSGGNQQKIVVAKNMATDAFILLLDDPTFGIDINAKAEIMEIVRKFVDKGNAALFVSSEFEEIASFCDRILIIRKGEISEILTGELETISQELLMRKVQ